MEDQFVSFETAKLAREKGFLEKTNKAYIHRYIEHTYSDYKGVLTDNILQSDISAPTQSLLQKWIREVHNIKISVNSSTRNMNGKWIDWDCFVNNKQIIDHRDGKDTYEEALEVGLIEALKFIKP